MLTEHRTEKMQRWKTTAVGKSLPVMPSKYYLANASLLHCYSVGEDKMHCLNKHQRQRYKRSCLNGQLFSLLSSPLLFEFECIMNIKGSGMENIGLSLPNSGLVPFWLASRCHHNTEPPCPGAL